MKALEGKTVGLMFHPAALGSGRAQTKLASAIMSSHISKAGLLWEYVNEGGANLVLRYTGDCDDFRGCVLRLRKGVKNHEAKRQIQEDSHFQRSVLQPLLAPKRNHLEPLSKPSFPPRPLVEHRLFVFCITVPLFCCMLGWLYKAWTSYAS